MSATRFLFLSARVGEVMTNDPVCLSGGETVAEVARLFDANEISGAPVVDGLHRLIGVVSRTDLIHRAAVDLKFPAVTMPNNLHDGRSGTLNGR